MGMDGIKHLRPIGLMSVIDDTGLEKKGARLEPALFIGAFGYDQPQLAPRPTGRTRGHFIGWGAVRLGHLARQRGHGDAVAQGDGPQLQVGKKDWKSFGHSEPPRRLVRGCQMRPTQTPDATSRAIWARIRRTTALVTGAAAWCGAWARISSRLMTGSVICWAISLPDASSA